MAKRCGTRNGRCPKPRANWWKQALGVDWFNHNQGGSDLVYSPEAQAVFDNMPDALPTALKTAIAAFVDSQVASGNWSRIIDFGYLGLNTEANSLKGFKGVAVPVNNSGIYNSYEVITTNGSSSYINLGFIPNDNADFGLNDCGVGAYVHVNQSTGATANALFGVIETAANTRQILLNQTGTGGSTIIGRVNVGNTNITYSSDNVFDNESLYKVERTASNACRIMKDDVQLATATTASAGKAQISIFIGGRNSDGSLNSAIKASFKFWFLYKAVGFDHASFSTASDQLISDITRPKLRLFVIGDSIARGTSNGTTSATADTLKEWNATNIVDITGDVAAAVTGSRYPSLADRIFTATGRVTHIVNTAEGGSEFSPNGDTNNWSTTGSRYALAKTNANNYLLTQPAGTAFDIILITLGINDVNGSADLSTIDTDAISLIDRINTDWPNTTILINQMGKGWSDESRYNSVRATIDNLVSTYANVYAGTDLNTYPAEAFYDGLHLSQAYNNTLGVDDANLIAALL